MKEVYELKNIIIEKGCIEDADRPFKLRPIEATEVLQFMETKDLEKGIRQSIEFSLREGCYFYRALCKHTGDLKFIMGLCPQEDSNIGVPWFLTSEDFKPDIDFIRGSREVISKDMYVEGIKVLCNYIHKDNTKSIKWLKWLGFQFTPHPFLNDYFQFYRYKE